MKENAKKNAPLADRMRPRTLDEFVGQDHIIGVGRLLRRAIQIDQLSSIIFYGPPGTGKTTLARIIANTTKAQFLSINAVLAGIKEIRESIESATQALSLFGRKTILFVDEVHRFNKSQQDALLPHVENGVLILIGATTENPYFEVNKALVSRSRIFQLRTLTETDLHKVAMQAIDDTERGYGSRNIVIDTNALDHLAKTSNGDARGILNALELAVETTSPDASGVIHITRLIAEESIQQKAVLYDKDGDAHYDTISAFIKSLRGSDADASLYWMAKMLYAGEDPRFIFRRMLILASEDIGLADPAALGVVTSCATAFDYVGLPEGRFHLAQAALYCATAPKSNSTLAFFDAIARVEKETDTDIPNPLKDASRDKDDFGHGKGYLYPHAFRDHWVAQQYLPDSLKGKIFYQPSDMGFEKEIAKNVARRREALVEAMLDNDDSSSPKNNSITDWLVRTTSDNELAHIRDTLFSLAQVNSETLFLDLCGRSGLLTLEAMRSITTGGVWTLCHDDASMRALEHLSASALTLDKPVLVKTSFDNWENYLVEQSKEPLVFSVIAGRDCFTLTQKRTELITAALRHCSPSGCIVLAETIRSEGQRIADLLPNTASYAECKELLRAAEEAAYAEQSFGAHAYSSQSLCAEISAFLGVNLNQTCEISTPQRRITRAAIASWFRESSIANSPSLGDRLLALGTKEQVDKLRIILETQLGNTDTPWKTVTLYLKITHAKQTISPKRPQRRLLKKTP